MRWSGLSGRSSASPSRRPRASKSAITGSGWRSDRRFTSIRSRRLCELANGLSVGGIPNRTTVCATASPLGNAQDDTHNIQDAINNCPSGQVVQLGVGVFTVGDGKYVLINKGITLRGAGRANDPYEDRWRQRHHGELCRWILSHSYDRRRSSSDTPPVTAEIPC